MNQSQSIDKLVALSLEFHIKTGADIELIKQFVRDIGEIHSKVAVDVMREEISKAFGKD